MKQTDILKELGIENASAALKQQVLQSLLVAVEAEFVGVVDDILDDDQAEELDKFESIEDVTNWLQVHVPQAAKIYEAVLVDQIAKVKSLL